MGVVPGISEDFLWAIKLLMGGLFAIIILVLLFYHKKNKKNQIQADDQAFSPDQIDDEQRAMLAYLEAHGKSNSVRKTPDFPQKSAEGLSENKEAQREESPVSQQAHSSEKTQISTPANPRGNLIGSMIGDKSEIVYMIMNQIVIDDISRHSQARER